MPVVGPKAYQEILDAARKDPSFRRGAFSDEFLRKIADGAYENAFKRRPRPAKPSRR